MSRLRVPGERPAMPNIAPAELEEGYLKDVDREEIVQEAIEQQWNLVSEVLRREIQSSPEVRKVLQGCIAMTVSETLPITVLSAIAQVSPRLSDIGRRYRDSLIEYIESPAASPVTLEPGIRDSYLLTLGERLRVARRYRFARDIKMLMLGAELHDAPTAALSETEAFVTPNGIRILATPDKPERVRDLLDPMHWVKRRQIKDRVYEVRTETAQCILKERKTDRHWDIKVGGHIPGNTSAEEFARARDFEERGPMTAGAITLSWEKPIGSIEFPDGFSAAFFEHEPGLMDMPAARSALVEAILAHPEQYAQEFARIQRGAEVFKDHSRIIGFTEPASEHTLLRLLRKVQKMIPQKVTMQEFAEVKAFRMLFQSTELLKEALIERDYLNSDFDGYAYRVRNGTTVGLDMIGFDFEYYQPIPPTHRSKRLEEQRKLAAMMNYIHLIPRVRANGDEMSLMGRAAYYALLHDEGMVFPKDPLLS